MPRSSATSTPPANNASGSATTFRTIVGGDVPIRTVWVGTDTTRIRDRLAHRGAERDQPKLSDWETYRTSVLDSSLANTGPAVVDYLVTN